MCRWLAYAGNPIYVDELVYAPVELNVAIVCAQAAVREER